MARFGECPVCGADCGNALYCSQSCAAAAGEASAIALDMLGDAVRFLTATPAIWRSRLEAMGFLLMLLAAACGNSEPSALLPVVIAGTFLLALGFALVTRAERPDRNRSQPSSTNGALR